MKAKNVAEGMNVSVIQPVNKKSLYKRILEHKHIYVWLLPTLLYYIIF